MDSLNADCLRRIFLSFNFKERIKLETVCSKWYNALQTQSAYSDIRYLDISKFLIACPRDYYQQERINFYPTVNGVVKRCGKYVKEFTFGQMWLKVSQNVIDSIARSCINLRVIDLGQVILNADISILLKKTAANLEFLSLQETSWISLDEAMKVQNFFQAMIQLQNLNLRTSPFLLTRLDEIKGQLTFLDISCARIPGEVLEKTMLKQIHLRELRISPAPNLCQTAILSLSNLYCLSTLHIGYSDRIDIDYSPLRKLVNIKELVVERLAALTEETLRQLLSAMTELEALSIRKCNRIRGYGAIALCTKLASLEISDTVQLADEDYRTLCEYGKLKRLSLFNCLNITTTGVNSALKTCQLQELHINNCPEITDEMVFTLAYTQCEITTVSLQNCFGLTRKGIEAVGLLKNLLSLQELDVSKNRQVDNAVVMKLYTALSLAHKREKKDYEGLVCNHEEFKRTSLPIQKTKLTVYISDTSVTSEICTQTDDLMNCIK